MTPNHTASHTVAAESLSPAAFAAFGDVAERPIDARRRYLPTSDGRAEDAAIFSFWISSAARLGSLPLPITTLERHPFSAQTFVPLGSSQYLAIVCHADPDGLPDVATLRCFIAGAHQSVTFARNVWHHPMTVLGAAMEFAVAMGMTGRQDDDVFVDIAGDVRAVMPQSA
ncbi:ureidoglycolate lyase [Tardiphaga sp. 20_F10_N6_6]|jgi:ureidoglycolate lyase|uniref:ureidoglycolate lyase n=1 Tax=Tardiphaga TaxID=1395974 RepID=UPI0008A81530|nr:MULTISPECIES: ureidoglycolate lyase [Tardiphaga]NUU41533.1 ureidoglycolate hydrolase [Tardiphaga robiniae]SEH58896.1 ureidoglycolate lyase [Tardiphaga sp. OK245]